MSFIHFLYLICTACFIAVFVETKGKIKKLINNKAFWTVQNTYGWTTQPLLPCSLHCTGPRRSIYKLHTVGSRQKSGVQIWMRVPTTQFDAQKHHISHQDNHLDVYPINSFKALISMIFLWDFCEILMGFPCYFSYFYDLSMGFLWDSYGISMLFLWSFYGISVRFLWDFHVISMIFLWDFCEITMGFQCYFYDLSMGFLLKFFGTTIGFLWNVDWK